MADSIVRLKVEDGSFNAKIKEAARSFADFGKRVASAGADAMVDFAKGVKTAKVAFQGFNAALKANALVLVASLAVQAASAIGEMIGDWISGADDAAEAQKRLNDQLEETKRLVEQINDEGDFNARIAKAQGKSTSDILQMKVDSARQAYNVALANVLNPALKAGTEEYDKAKKVEEQAQKRLQKALQDQQVDAIARQYKTGEYAAKGGGGGRSGKTNLPSIDDFNKILFKSMKANIKPDDVMGPSDAWNAYTGDIRTGLEGIDDELTNLTKFTNNFDPYLEFLKDAAKRTKQVAEANELAAQSANNLGSALAGIDDPSAKAAGTVIQAIANIALGFSQAAAQASSLGPYGWMAYMAAGAGALATTISTIHSLTGYAEGGEIKGNSYSGDNIPIMANAGEIVLNKAQQATLANSLTGQTGNLRVTGILQGTSLVMCVENTLRSQGKGELATWKS